MPQHEFEVDAGSQLLVKLRVLPGFGGVARWWVFYYDHEGENPQEIASGDTADGAEPLKLDPRKIKGRSILVIVRSHTHAGGTAVRLELRQGETGPDISAKHEQGSTECRFAVKFT